MSGHGEIQRTLPASLEAIEQFFTEFRLFCDCLPRKERFVAELLLREALTNAVLHGCGSNPERSVRCSLRLEDRCLMIVIADDGEGFDWRRTLERRMDTAAASGRGFEILRQYATQVRFNGKGNEVTIQKRFS